MSMAVTTQRKSTQGFSNRSELTGKARVMNSSKSNALSVLDCTLRDGGYYTNWTFSDALVADYLTTMSALPVKAVELGYAGKGPEFGRFARLTNSDICRFRPNSQIMLAVMLDAKDFFVPDEDLDDCLLQALGPKTKDGIDAVRVAANFGQVHRCIKLIEKLRVQGYRVFLNLMKIDLATPSEIAQCLKAVEALSDIEAVYIADSLGSMCTDRVKDLCKLFSNCQIPALGFHAHDNCGIAIANSISARAAGATWLDSTVSGMGRGAGNARTEQLIQAISEQECSLAAQDLLQRLIVRYFNPLQRQHGWGDNLFYQVGAGKGLHPTYVQEVLNDHSLSDTQALFWIRTIPDNRPTFSRDILEEARKCAFYAERLVTPEIVQVAQ